MQDIDPVYFLTPLTVIAISAGLITYWHIKRRFTRWTLFLSAIAYGAAILVKVLFQDSTIGPFEREFGTSHFVLGVYFGLQTVILEVEGAYVISRYAFSHSKIEARDAESYGLGLAFWENAILFSVPLLLDYAVYYIVLGSGHDATSGQLFSQLSANAPALFYSASRALPIIGLVILERVSSLLFHFSWGYLCVMAVAFKKKSLLGLGLPMGLVDFITEFEPVLGLSTYEGLTFVLGLASVCAALSSTRQLRKSLIPTERTNLT